jgi:hypothetical protein
MLNVPLDLSDVAVVDYSVDLAPNFLVLVRTTRYSQREPSNQRAVAESLGGDLTFRQFE